MFNIKIMKKIFICSILLVFVANMEIIAQEMKNWALNGYITSMQTATFEKVDKGWLKDNFIHNRLKFNWYPTDNITFKTELRNRFIWGDNFEVRNNYDKEIGKDNGFVDGSFNISSGDSYVLNSKIDRLWFRYTSGDFELTVGRQRINWSRSYVWNPNDVFNSYSYFDFDYEEKPGSDAVRLQYYTGVASSLDVAFSLNADEELTAAGRWIFNKWNYDFQVIAGIFEDDDYFIGGGWEGSIMDAGFSGEFNYLRPKEDFADTTGLFFADIGTFYTFENSLTIRFEAYYNEFMKDVKTTNLFELFSSDLSIKNISFSEWSFMGSVSYPITPLFNASFAIMHYPDLDGWFIGPSLDYSLSENLKAAFHYQDFSGNFMGDGDNKHFRIGSLRFKYSF